MDVLQSPRAPEAIGPYSQAIVAGSLVFVSGQLPINAATGEMEREPGAAAKQSLANIEAILHERGLDLSDIVKVTIFLADMADFQKVNEAYSTLFRPPYPARACVAAKQLPKNAVLEIEAIAALRE